MPKNQQETVKTKGPLYDPSKSNTYKQFDGEKFAIGYADGSGASGPVGREKIDIGGASLPSMPFGVCNDLKYNPDIKNPTRDTDGPVGLAFKYGNSSTLASFRSGTNTE